MYLVPAKTSIHWALSVHRVQFPSPAPLFSTPSLSLDVNRDFLCELLFLSLFGFRSEFFA